MDEETWRIDKRWYRVFVDFVLGGEPEDRDVSVFASDQSEAQELACREMLRQNPHRTDLHARSVQIINRRKYGRPTAS